MPGETPIPDRTCSLPVLFAEASSILIELAFDQAGERFHRGRRVRPGCADLDHRTRGGGEHHQPHDRCSRHRGPVLAYRDLGIELRSSLDETGSGAGVEPFLIADLDLSP